MSRDTPRVPTPRTDDRAITFPARPATPRGWEFVRYRMVGHAWITAVAGHVADDDRLARGRSYARTGKVGAITIAPGEASARVVGSRDSDYRVSLAVPVFTGAQWELARDVIAAKASYLAALQAGSLPLEMLSALADADVELIPEPGRVYPDCSCPDWGHPCKHAAALAYQVGQMIEEDLFALLLLRGRSETELAGRVRHRADQVLAGAADHDRPGVSAWDVFGHEPTGLESVAAILSLELPISRDGAEPGPRPVTPTPPGIDAAGMQAVAADTAERARAYLRGAAGAVRPLLPRLTGWNDTIGLVADLADTELADALSNRAATVYCIGRDEVDRAVAAWKIRQSHSAASEGPES